MGVISKRHLGWCRVEIQFLAIFLSISAMAFPARAETVPILTTPTTVTPTAGQLEYYGTDSGYLCKSYPPNYPQPYSPTGTDKNAVALAMAKLIDASGEAIYKGDGSYDGKTNSYYYTHQTWPNSVIFVVTQYICPVGSEGSPAYNCAVIPNSRNNPNECCPCGYSYDTGQHMCVVNPSRIATCTAQCPTVAEGETPYTLDPGGKTCSRPDRCVAPNVIDPKTGKCGPPPCTAIDPLPDLPEPKDDKDYACTQSLEAGRGKDINKACGSMTPDMEKGAKCLADKIHALGIPYSEPSATIRTEAYQKHLLDVWKWNKKIKFLSDSDKQACAARIADVENEMNNLHGIDSDPSSKGSQAPHVKGEAVDVSKDVAKALMAKVTIAKLKARVMTFYPNCIKCLHAPLVTGDVQDYINSSALSPACNLKWGGLFKPVDKVHFQLPPPPKK